MMNIHAGRLAVAAEGADLLGRLGVRSEAHTDGTLPVLSPITGEAIALCPQTDPAAARAAIERAHDAFLAWRRVPAPKRGELVRLLGEELRAAKIQLGRLVTLEAGKIVSEGLGEVQEMIDICDYAVGLSRQLHGLTMATERPSHRMMETWHPLGVTGIISAFNFPVAVWSWNAALALVCGNSCVWKPSEKTPLTALAVQALVERAAGRLGGVPPGLTAVLIGGPRHRRGSGRRSAGAGSVGHRLDRDGPPRRPAARVPLRPGDPGARRQQCGHRLPVRRPRSRSARDRVRRHGDRRPALHHPASPARPRRGLRAPAGAAQSCLRCR